MENLVEAAAYELKEGGFRGVALDKRNGKERHASPVLPTIEAARHWARVKVDELMGGQPWQPGYRYKPYWMMFVWTHHRGS